MQINEQQLFEFRIETNDVRRVFAASRAEWTRQTFVARFHVDVEMSKMRMEQMETKIRIECLTPIDCRRMEKIIEDLREKEQIEGIRRIFFEEITKD